MPVIFPETQDLLYELSKKTAISYKMFREEFPDLMKNDIRVTTFSMCANTVENILFSCIFQKEQLTDTNWYKKVSYIKDITDTQIKTIQEVYNSFLIVTFVTEYFSIFEHFFRVLIKKINSNSNKNQIYEIIETVLIKFNLKNYQRIFDLFRFIRNANHNNGRITDKYTYPILYNGVHYELKQNTLLIVDWVMLCNLSWDMQECMRKIIHSDKIPQLGDILDPSFPTEDIGYQAYDVNQFS